MTKCTEAEVVLDPLGGGFFQWDFSVSSRRALYHSYSKVAWSRMIPGSLPPSPAGPPWPNPRALPGLSDFTTEGPPSFGLGFSGPGRVVLGGFSLTGSTSGRGRGSGSLTVPTSPSVAPPKPAGNSTIFTFMMSLEGVGAREHGVE